MKGYITPMGYMGYVNGNYCLFASEGEYAEYIRELDEDMITPQAA